jgi:hypothetical protein
MHLLSQACVFIYSSHGKWVFPHSCGVYLQFTWEVGLPPLLWSFPPTAAFRSFPTPCCWVCATALAFSSRFVVRDFPFPLFCTQGTPPSLLHVFLVVIVCYSGFFFFFFPLVGGQSVQGAMLIWPRVVCVSPVSRLAHLVVCIFPSHLGAAVWHRKPPGFSI